VQLKSWFIKIKLYHSCTNLNRVLPGKLSSDILKFWCGLHILFINTNINKHTRLWGVFWYGLTVRHCTPSCLDCISFPRLHFTGQRSPVKKIWKSVSLLYLEGDNIFQKSASVVLIFFFLEIPNRATEADFWLTPKLNIVFFPSGFCSGSCHTNWFHTVDTVSIQSGDFQMPITLSKILVWHSLYSAFWSLWADASFAPSFRTYWYTVLC
jgi:hypothetical protein